MLKEVKPTASAVARKYLRLQCAAGVGPVCARKLIEHFGNVDAVFDASLSALEQVEEIGVYRAKSVVAARRDEAAEAAVEQAERCGARIICYEDEGYPPLLKHTPDPPVCLYVRGRLTAEDGVAMAIVGSRRCSRYGLEQSERFGGVLARAGFTIVSGLARGADGAAHRGALDARGRTVAVLGCGLGHLYPPEHADLAERIVERGALISELPVDTPPEAKNFIPRNRIIAGMSLGVIVAECAKRSGALATARFASEYNREVFAIPGQISNPLAAGTNGLIRDGQAKLVTCVEDVMDELGEVGRLMRPDADSPGAPAATVALDANERAVMDSLGLDDTPLEHVCDHSGCSPAQVAAALTQLQMKGLVVQRPGSLFARRPL